MSTRIIEISNTDDVIDVRDVIARVEELEELLPPADESDGTDNEERQELATLMSLLDDLKGNGGDVDWRGDWYPLLLVRDSHFRDFAQQEAEDLGLIKSDSSWPDNCIDWEQAAQELQVDYTTCEFEGVTYWYR